MEYNMQIKRNTKGFTLLEILLVIAAIGILAVIVLVAINPNRQLAQARDTARQSDINTLQKVLDQYLIDTGAYPASVSTTPRYICNTGSLQSGGPACTGFVDLKVLVPNYIAAIPRDTQSVGDNAGYMVSINPSNNRIVVIANLAERKSIAINALNAFVVTNGLVLNLDAGDTASYPGSGNSWFDLSGNGNNATLTNGPTYNSANGGSLSFDGVDDFATAVINNSSGDWPHTVNFWFMLPAGQSVLSGRVDPFVIGMTPATSQYSAIDIYSNAIQWYNFSNDLSYNTTQFTSGTWWNICLTYSGGGANTTNKRMFINGAQITWSGGAGAAVISLPANTNVSIGRDGPRNGAYFPGRISSFAIYNRAISTTEVTQNFNATRGRYGL
jgi:prepilin-type N-terminal cleavage/methylation domain-containing protein